MTDAIVLRAGSFLAASDELPHSMLSPVRRPDTERGRRPAALAAASVTLVAAAAGSGAGSTPRSWGSRTDVRTSARPVPRSEYLGTPTRIGPSA